MNINLIRGIQLPAFDVEMLNIGRIIAVPFKQYMPEQERFWVYPCQSLPLDMSIQNYYQSEYWEWAEQSSRKSQESPIQLTSWATADYHWHIYPGDHNLLKAIAQNSIWNLSALEKILEQNQVLRLLFLRVYRLDSPCLIHQVSQAGSYFWPHESDVLVSAKNNDIPIVTTPSFRQRKANLMHGKQPNHASLEKLCLQIAYSSNPSAQTLELAHSVKRSLGISVLEAQKSNDSMTWIYNITALGERSKEEDAGKSNYQAGTDFENIVCDSLRFLGFQIDYSHRGGAGGIDVYCPKPYSTVIECKSGKKIPNDTAVQLLNLGTIRLESKTHFLNSVKLIIGPGEPTDQLEKAAKVHGMSILHPSTLEKLVTLNAAYIGAVDVFKLKDYLVDGRADESVERYIGQIKDSIKLRIQIIELLKKYLEKANSEDASLTEVHAVYIASELPTPLSRDEMHDILVELSSPLTGYLGRRKADDGSDRYYYLRSLTPPQL